MSYEKCKISGKSGYIIWTGEYFGLFYYRDTWKDKEYWKFAAAVKNKDGELKFYWQGLTPWNLDRKVVNPNLLLSPDRLNAFARDLIAIDMELHGTQHATPETERVAVSEQEKKDMADLDKLMPSSDDDGPPD